MFYNYQSNSLKELALLFSSEIEKAKKKSVLTPLWIVVQNKEAQQWLTLEVAKNIGIASNFEFVLPSELMWKLYRLENSELPKILPSDRTSIHLQLFDFFENDVQFDSSSKIMDVLPSTQKGRFQFAEQIADVFDLYQVYRPEILKGWEVGKLSTSDESEIWQSKLWLLLIEGWRKKYKNTPHRGEAFGELIKKLQSTSDYTALPSQVFIFGLSQFSNPFSLLARNLAKKNDVHFFQLGSESISDQNPLKRLDEEWGEAKRKLHTQLGSQLSNDSELQAHNINRTISSKNLLTSFNSDSVRIHSCHNSKREVEVLKDELLKVLDENEEFGAEDILVMVPNLEEYAPNILSIFNGDDLPNVPIQVYPVQQDELQLALTQLFELLSSPFKVNAVLEFLEHKLIRNRFEIGEEELLQIKKWLHSSSIHWGLLEEDSSYSLEKGTKSLLAGFSMEIGELKYLDSFVPSSEVNTSDNAILSAKFSAFVHLLTSYKKVISSSKSISEWIGLSLNLISDLSSVNAVASSGLQNTFQRLLDCANLFDSKIKINFEFYKDWIKDQLSDVKASSSGLGRGVVLSTYIPYRTIPFTCVFMLGMNEGIFPRTSTRPSFDLIDKYPKIGDRIMKEDDVSLFLEILQSTSHHLSISYLGQDQYNDTERLPSILIQKMMDELDIKNPKKHKLHGFDASYFLTTTSYSKKRKKLSEIQLHQDLKQSVFFDDSLNFLGELDIKNIEIFDLITFFTHPCKYILSNCLGISTQYEEALLDDREVFSVKGLNKYVLDQIIHKGISSSINKDHIKNYSLVAGYSPQGLAGDRGFENEYENVNSVFELIESVTKNEETSTELNLKINDSHIRGKVGQIFDRKRVVTKMAKLKAKDLVAIWINHLLLVEAEVIDESIIIGKEKEGKPEAYILSKVKEPSAHIKCLIELYKAGFSGKNQLTFFPETSKAFIDAKLSEKPKDFIKEAEKKWIGSDFIKGEGADYFNQLIWKNESPILKKSFSDQAESFWIPFNQHVQNFDA